MNHTTYTDNTIGVFSGTLHIQFPTQAAGQKYLDLAAGDKIIANRIDADESVTITLSASPTWNNTNKSIDVASTGFTLTGTFTAGRTYDVWAFVVADRRAGSLFITNGEYWAYFWAPKVPTWVGNRRQNKTPPHNHNDRWDRLTHNSQHHTESGRSIDTRPRASLYLTGHCTQSIWIYIDICTPKERHRKLYRDGRQ